MKFEVNGNTYEFFNNCYDRKDFILLESKLEKNGTELSSDHIRYYSGIDEKTNKYQLVMMSAVYKQMMQIEKGVVKEYKKKNHIKRLTDVKKVEIERLLEDNSDYQELKQVYFKL